MRERNQTNTNTDILTILQLIFIVLKLTNLIDWAWSVVLIPTWIGLAIVLLIIILKILSRL